MFKENSYTNGKYFLYSMALQPNLISSWDHLETVLEQWKHKLY